MREQRKRCLQQGIDATRGLAVDKLLSLWNAGPQGLAVYVWVEVVVPVVVVAVRQVCELLCICACMYACMYV